MSVPFIDAAQRGTNRVNEREDYTRPGEIVTRLEDGRLPMNVVTDRDDGQDVTVYAPCVVSKLGDVDPDGPIPALLGVAFRNDQPKESNGLDR